VALLADEEEYAVVRITFLSGEQLTLAVAWQGNPEQKYRTRIDGERFEWRGASRLEIKK
jgi:hypothetical protein